MPSSEICANLHLSFSYILGRIILLIILPKQKEWSDDVIITKCSSSFSASLCSQIYCIKNGDMRSTVSLFPLDIMYPMKHHKVKDLLCGRNIKLESMWPLLIMCSRKFQGCKHPWTTSIVLEYSYSGLSLKPQWLWSYENLSFFF